MKERGAGHEQDNLAKNIKHRRAYNNSHLFGSIHHHNGFEMKQTRCALTADFQL